MDQNTVQICQKCKETPYYVHFATLYSPYHKIPLYSAYYFNPGAPNRAERKEWFIEPKLSGGTNEYMERETLHMDEKYQAVNADYIGSGYDRGHLNPRFFQTGFGRDATFTLTNAAPMDPCFNRVYWYQWEAATKKYLKELTTKYQKELKLKDPKDAPEKVYIITGTVPQKDTRMPPLDRVNVPSVVWTAVCVHRFTAEEKSLSFGYMGENRADNVIQMMSIPQMNAELSKLYGTAIKIFKDDCRSENYKTVHEEYMDILKKTDTLTTDD
ncbi:endonuclease domain-containing 1 protein-like [Astyanax mexicanus]|uniref:endonuclease domain-containing 1 protein-like n=1 Tax=Astyanax mexicanus TaxID=7994 RepID=UPI0020CAA688|nr:endonuclease domain-containing 1 protein-like [Astyanax mexicanus]